MSCGSSRESPLIKVVAPEMKSQGGIFLVDTGVDVSLVKASSLEPDVLIQTYDTATISGIITDKLQTLGTTDSTIQGNPHEFHVVRSSFPLTCGGILGKDYLRKEKAEITFTHNTLVTKIEPV